MSIKNLLFVLDGVWITLSYTVIAVVIGFILGIPISVARSSKCKALSAFTKAYISIIRGTPILLQLSFWYFAFPRLSGINISSFIAGSIAFSINSSAYIAEIIRSGINSVDKGQVDAAKVLGIQYIDIFMDIILPQAIKNISPALMNEMISMLKETAVIGVIGVLDLTRRAQLVGAETYDFFTPLIIAAAAYYIVGLLISSMYYLIFRKHNNY